MLNKLAAIIRKDLLLRFQSRAELLFFLVLPLVFTFLIGGGLSSGGPGEDDRIVVPVVDEDGGAGATAFLTALGESETVRAETYPRAEAESLLQGNDVGAILIIPTGFSAGLTAEGLLGGDQAEVILQAASNSNFGEIVQQEVNRAVSDLARPLLIARNSVQSVESIRPFTGDDERAAFFENALAAAESLLADQPARVDFTVLAGEGGAYDQQAQSSAGQLITWVFIPLLGASGLFAFERALGTLRRLLITPTRNPPSCWAASAASFLPPWSRWRSSWPSASW
jgi:ABC-2 type transport system permease protein